MVCFRDDIEDGEMQVPFGESFTVKVRNRWSIIFILKRAFHIKDSLDFIIKLLICV